MPTKVYGCSDDLIEFDGDLHDETYGSDDDYKYLVFNDGTVAKVKYGKPADLGVWEIVVLTTGSCFDRLEPCFDSEAEIYSDILYLKDGITSVLIFSDEPEMIRKRVKRG